MKKFGRQLAFVLVALFLTVAVAGCSTSTDEGSGTAKTPENPTIRLSTTTSVNDSGLLPYLQKDFEADTGYKLEITSAGTGAAIEKGKTGDADVLLVHSKAAEEEFINEGYGVERIVLMHNYFVIAGPKNDPAGIKGSATAADAFKKIADSQSIFVSRGDDSGTHKAEMKIWAADNIDPVGQPWYVSTGQGMGASLNVASEQQGYILTDKATYLSHEKKDTLDILLAESDDMKNTYSMIVVNKDKWPDTNTAGAEAFTEWMMSDKAQKLIADYGAEEYGEALFFVEK